MGSLKRGTSEGILKNLETICSRPILDNYSLNGFDKNQYRWWLRRVSFNSSSK